MTAPLIDHHQTDLMQGSADPLEVTTEQAADAPIDTAIGERIPGVEYLEDTHPILRAWDTFCRTIRRHFNDERGMSTIEYALGCVAAAALGALLYVVVTSDAVESALSGIFERALSEGN